LALTRETKNEILAGYLKVLEKAQGLVITEYRGFRMKQFNETRKIMRANNGAYMVTKNTLFKIALKQVGMAAPDELLNGPVAVGVAFGDLPGLTKVILARAKEDEMLKPKGAIMGLTVFTQAQLEMVSTMPTLDEARAGLIGTLVAPATAFLSILEQPATQLLALFQAYADKDKNPDAPADAA